MTPPAPLLPSIPPSLCEIEGATEGLLRARIAALPGAPPLLLRAAPLAARLLGSVVRRPASPSGPFYLPTEPLDLFPSSSWAVLLPRPTIPHDREEAAAALVFAALRIRKQISDGSWEQDFDNGDPLEHSVYFNFFSRSLVPESPYNFLLRDSESRYIIALVRGRAFRIDLYGKGGTISRASIAAALRRCVDLAPSTPAAPAILSAAPCDLLSSTYRKLCSDQQNLSSLRTLSEAIFFVCLDETNPESPEEAGFQLHAGNPSNRWFLHGLQFVAFHGGATGVVGCFETGLEGQPAIRFVGELAKVLMNSAAPTPPSGAPLRVSPLLWNLQPDDMAPLAAECEKNFRRAPESVLHLSFNKNDANSLGIPSICAFHVLVQAALIHETGHLPQGEILQQVGMRHLEGKRLALLPVMAPEFRDFGLRLKAGADAATLRAAAQSCWGAYRALISDTKNVHSQEGIFQEAQALVPRRLRSPLMKALSALPRPREIFRLSLLPKPQGIPILGRFGVPSRVPTSIWAHPILEDDRATMVCSSGKRAVVKLGPFQHHFEQALAKLRSAMAR